MAARKTRTIIEIVQEYLAGGQAELPVFDRTSARNNSWQLMVFNIVQLNFG